MSILDHNPQYEKEMDPSDPNFGKFFWFSGSMKRPKKSKEVKEEQIIEVPINLEESAVESRDEDVKGGTYFKLNGSFGDSDLSDIEPEQHADKDFEEENDEDGGGRWFGVSVRQHRAESMQDLLKIGENILEKTSQTLLEIGENDLEGYKDSLHNDSIDHVPEESVIDQQLLESFDAQFLEIEKLVLESFDDIDFGVTSPTYQKPKKNKRFGIDDIEHNISPASQQIVNNNEPPTRPSRPIDYKSKSSKKGTSKKDFILRENPKIDTPKKVFPQKESPQKGNPSLGSTSEETCPVRPPPPNGYTDKSTKKKHSITVSSPDAGQNEYKIGETIHFKVSVDKKHALSHELSDDVFAPSADQTLNPVETTEQHSHETPKRKDQGKKRKTENASTNAMEERINKYENKKNTEKPKDKRSNKSKQIKEKSKDRKIVQQVEEEIAHEEYVKDSYTMNDLDMDFIDTYLTENTSTPNVKYQPQKDEVERVKSNNKSLRKENQNTSPVKSTSEAPRMLLKRQMQITSSSNTQDKENNKNDRNTEDSRSEFDSSEDEANLQFKRSTSFRRSIIIEDDEVSVRRRKSIGGTSVSVAFIAINKKPGEETGKVTTHQRLKGILNFLDNMVLDDESLGLYYDSVRQLHTVFWDLKDGRKEDAEDTGETLSTALNFLVVQEWPKVMLGCFKKLKAYAPHVFREEENAESTVYYSGHLPSLLRMNRTTSEFAVSVIFDGLLRAAINFTDVHEASRQACCEDKLLAYLMDDLMSEMHNIKWGKATAREMFLKSMSDLIYNCAQSYSNASYLLEHNCVDVFTQIRIETFHIVDARKVNMTLLLTLSYLIDDNNYDIIVPDEGSIIRVLQFLDKSLEHSEHTHHDFYAAELAGCLSRLAGHSTNKVLITRNSGQEILHKLLKYAYDDEERVSACHALWNLSFCREAKDILRGMSKLMNLLRDLSASSNAQLHQAAAGIIWECEDKYDIKGAREIHSASPGHVMISYEYEAQPLVIGVRDELNRQGYQVWMNSDVEERSLQDIMSKGVEKASVIIVAITRKYKLTPYAFAEADYAHTLRKKIVPIIIDVDFVPDGWLKELIGEEQTFDFSRRSMLAGSLDALVEHITSLSSPGLTNGSSLNTESPGKNRNSDVLSWSNADVIFWLKENQLIRSVSNAGRLNKLTGLHLIMFFDLKRESPDYYYSVLDSHLGFKDVLDTLEFTYAMDRLLGSERLI